MRLRFALALALLLSLNVISTSSLADEKQPLFVLSQTRLGPLELKENATISEAKLKKLFPNFTVTYEIGQGDSPDFHYFEVLDKKGELLFSISSFIEDDSQPSKKTTSEVPINLLQIYSNQVVDSYGLRVGDRVKDIITKRGKNLTFGAAHHDVLLGGEKIYYSISTGREQSPENFKLKDAIRNNWKIHSLSWPSAAWD